MVNLNIFNNFNGHNENTITRLKIVLFLSPIFLLIRWKTTLLKKQLIKKKEFLFRLKRRRYWNPSFSS